MTSASSILMRRDVYAVVHFPAREALVVDQPAAQKTCVARIIAVLVLRRESRDRKTRQGCRQYKYYRCKSFYLYHLLNVPKDK